MNNSCKYSSDNRAIPYVLELNLSENNLSGEIPEGCLTRMGPLTDISIWGNKIKGSYPYEVNNLYPLSRLELACNRFSGPLTLESTLALPSLYFINLEDNYFEGTLPDGEAVKAFLEGKSPTWFIIKDNLFKGKVPESYSNDPQFSTSWIFIFPQKEGGLDFGTIFDSGASDNRIFIRI